MRVELNHRSAAKTRACGSHQTENRISTAYVRPRRRLVRKKHCNLAANRAQHKKYRHYSHPLTGSDERRREDAASEKPLMSRALSLSRSLAPHVALFARRELRAREAENCTQPSTQESFLTFDFVSYVHCDRDGERLSERSGVVCSRVVELKCATTLVASSEQAGDGGGCPRCRSRFT